MHAVVIFQSLNFHSNPGAQCSDAVRALAKAKASAAEVAAACQDVPSEEAQQAGASGRPKDMLAAFSAFQREMAGLAAAGAPPGEVLAACDR